MKRFASFADDVLPWLTLTTMIAALAMSLSSVSVITNGLRLRRVDL